jgi:pentatricopeptide repeat protein
MCSRGIAPDAAAYKLAGTAVAKADRLKELSQLLAVMEREGVVFEDCVVYNAAITAHSRAGDWEGALTLLKRITKVYAHKQCTLVTHVLLCSA